MAARARVRAGDLRHQLTIYRIQKVRDAAGAWDEQRVPIKTLPGRVVPLSGQELMQARQVDEQVTHMVFLRYDPDVAPLTARDEVEHVGRSGVVRTFNIRGVIDPEERGVVWHITAREAEDTWQSAAD